MWSRTSLLSHLLPKLLVVGGVLALLVPGLLEARPDPLGERKRPTLQAPPKPPPPRPDTKGQASDPDASPKGVRAATSETAARNTTAPADEVARDNPRAKSSGSAGEKSPAGDKTRPTSAGGDDGTYKLGPRDQLRIEVWNQADIEYEWRPVTVSDEGTISLPLLDSVKVGGITVTEAIAKLTKLYDAFIISPQVFIQIVEYNSRIAMVTGEVKSSGPYPLKSEMTLTELLAQAGGVTSKASKYVRLVRQRPGSSDGAPEVRDVDLDRIAAGDARENIKIQPGDEVMVLPNKNIVYVTGAVKAEGYVEFEDGMTAQQAVILAGGLAEGAAAGRTRVFRQANGQTVEFKVDVRDQKHPFLRHVGDIIKFPYSIL
jgi:polysaccharide export outer membrane protein